MKSVVMKTAEARNTIKELRAMRRPPKFVGSQDVPIAKYDQIHMMLRDGTEGLLKNVHLKALTLKCVMLLSNVSWSRRSMINGLNKV